MCVSLPSFHYNTHTDDFLVVQYDVNRAVNSLVG